MTFWKRRKQTLDKRTLDVRQVWPDRFQDRGRRPLPRCFVDRRGNRYTFEVCASEGDWWIGSKILMPCDDIETLDHGIPLIEVDPISGVPLGNGEPVESEAHITCPVCLFTSYNRNDIREAYCGRCHWWTGKPEWLLALREKEFV